LGVRLAVLRSLLEYLAEKLGGRVYRVVLFSSVTKGTADVDSDVDVLVVVDRVSKPASVFALYTKSSLQYRRNTP